MFIGQKVSELIESNKVKKVTLYEYLEICKAQLDNIINGKNIPNGKVIEGLADFFNVSTDVFFDRKFSSHINIGHQVNGDGNNLGNIELNECQAEVRHLKELLKEKEALLQEKERLIKVLMKNV